ncbi:MAG: sigma-54-dependent Fis family transcriptional regulator, partial [Candidatus Woesearchaeota archaeon]
IAQELPFVPIKWEEAEELFEKEYFKKLLEENLNIEISKLAKKIKLRYETLHRKLKKLGIK